MMSARDERLYTDEDIVELLEKAAKMGIPLGKGCDLENYNVEELERMVNQVQ